MKKGVKIISGILISLAVMVVLVLVAFTEIKKPSVVFDFSSQSALTGRASGFLYGFAEEDIPTREIAESIGISSLATKTAGGLQHPIGDVGSVSDTFLSAGGEMLMVYTQDMYDTWYYQLDSLEEYNEKVRKTVTEMEGSPYRDHLVYCIYNEMDNGAWLGSFWEEENRYKFYDAWKETYELVREINPEARLAGPGHCGYNYDFIKEFLAYCKKNDCLPQVVVWHELSDQSIYWMEHNFEGYYSICEELGIERLPVCISEYGLMSTNGIPGESVKWISRLEKQDAYGCVAYWRLANNLSDTVADDVTPNGNYWVYNFYGQMKGRELACREWDMMHSNIGNYLKGKYPLMNKGFIALGSYDEKEDKFYILAGGSGENSRIKIENIPKEVFGSGEKVKIEISYADYKGLGGAVNSPTDYALLTEKVKNGCISFTLPCERESAAYFITITRGEGEEYINKDITLRYEAEATRLSDALTVSGAAYALSGSECVRGIQSEKPAVFEIKADKKGEYKLSIVYGSLNTGDEGRKSILTDVMVGENTYTVKCPSTIKEDCMECVSVYVSLEKGKNTVKLVPEEGASLVLDFIDVTEREAEPVIFAQRLSSRNTPVGENAYSVILPFDGHYKLQGITDENIIVNGYSIKGDGDGVFYFSRGYNKIVFAHGQILTAVYAEDVDTEPVIFTPDDVILTGGATNEENTETSSHRHIGWISSETGSKLHFTADAPSDGVYAFTVEYANNEEGGYHDYNVDLVERYITVYVDGIKEGNFFFRSTYSWDNFKTKTIFIELAQGEHEITFANDGSYSFNDFVTYAPNIGSIAMHKVN